MTKMIFSLILAGFGFVFPFGLSNLWYYLNGHFDAFYNIVYLAPSRYTVTTFSWAMMKFIFDYIVHFLPVYFLFVYVLIDRKFIRPEISSMKMLCLIWFILDFTAVLITGRRFGHYTIQLMLPVSLMAGLFFHSERSYPAYLRPLAYKKTGWIILAALILFIAMLKIEYLFKKDVPREIAAYLRPRLKAEDVIYAGNYYQVIYFLLKKDSPTKYIHRSLLFKEDHVKTLDIKVDEEFRHIIAQRPDYIIIWNDFPSAMMNDFVNNYYIPDKDFGDRIRLFRLLKD
jgi:hypothetical protein